MSFSEFGDLDFGVENPQSLKVPYLKVIKPTSGEAGAWGGNSQIRPGEFVSSGNANLHGFAIEFYPVVGFPVDERGRPKTGRRYVDPVDYTKTLCRSWDGVRPVTDHSVGDKPPFYDLRTNTLVEIDFALKPRDRQYGEDGYLHVGGCGVCPLGQWNDKTPPPCKPAAVLPVYVARSIVFDPTGGLQGDPLNFFREQHEKGTDMAHDDSLMVQYFDFEDWKTLMVWSLEKFALDAIVMGNWTVAAEKPKVANVNHYLQRYIHEVPVENKHIDELLRGVQGGPEALLVFRNAAGELFDVAGARAYVGDDLEYYGLRALRAYTIQTPNRNPANQPHITPKLTLGTYVMVKGTGEYDEYMEWRRQTATRSVPELLGWRTTEDFMTFSDDMLPAPALRPALPSGDEGYAPPQASGNSVHTVSGYGGFESLIEDED